MMGLNMKCNYCGSENEVFYRDSRNGILCRTCKLKKDMINARSKFISYKKKNRPDR
jgi:hypothetical protein